MIESDSEGRRRERRRWTADLLDLEDGRMPFPVLDRAAVRALLEGRPRIAIIGASPSPARPSHGVLVDLLSLGFDIVPVNPAADAVAGLRCYATLREAVDATGPVDIVDVFRAPDALPAIAADAVKIHAGCLWCQFGVIHEDGARIADAGDVPVVMDRCLKVEHARYVGRMHWLGFNTRRITSVRGGLQ